MVVPPKHVIHTPQARTPFDSALRSELGCFTRNWNRCRDDARDSDRQFEPWNLQIGFDIDPRAICKGRHARNGRARVEEVVLGRIVAWSRLEHCSLRVEACDDLIAIIGRDGVETKCER